MIYLKLKCTQHRGAYHAKCWIVHNDGTHLRLPRYSYAQVYVNNKSLARRHLKQYDGNVHDERR